MGYREINNLLAKCIKERNNPKATSKEFREALINAEKTTIMTIFTVTITQGQYEERTETTLIFSSLEKVQEWKDSYKTSADSFYYYGEERAQIKEIEVDTNKLISISDSFCIDNDYNDD